MLLRNGNENAVKPLCFLAVSSIFSIFYINCPPSWRAKTACDRVLSQLKEEVLWQCKHYIYGCPSSVTMHRKIMRNDNFLKARDF